MRHFQKEPNDMLSFVFFLFFSLGEGELRGGEGGYIIYYYYIIYYLYQITWNLSIIFC